MKYKAEYIIPQFIPHDDNEKIQSVGLKYGLF